MKRQKSVRIPLVVDKVRQHGEEVCQQNRCKQTKRHCLRVACIRLMAKMLLSARLSSYSSCHWQTSAKRSKTSLMRKCGQSGMMYARRRTTQFQVVECTLTTTAMLQYFDVAKHAGELAVMFKPHLRVPMMVYT